MDPTKAAKKRFDQIIERAIPSQIPVTVTRDSYMRMLEHCHTDSLRGSIWCCSKTNARINVKMWYRTVLNADGSINAVHIPVGVLYCSGCDKPPRAIPESVIAADAVQTVAM